MWLTEQTTSVDELVQFTDKVEWEGGLAEYVLAYGGEVPAEVYADAEDLKAAWGALRASLNSLLANHGMSAEF